MKKILSIGNSFSEDATTFLYDIAASGNMHCKVVNLFIGGCPLSLHAENIKDDNRSYLYQLNGQSMEDKWVSVKEILLEEEWDIVTMQQVSSLSGIYDSYFPYIYVVNDFVKEHCRSAKRILHETWSYEADSEHPGFVNYGYDQRAMYEAIVAANSKVATELGLEIIPTGHLIQKIREESALFDYKKTGRSLCADGFHLDRLYGRYAAAVLWYKQLFGGDIIKNDFVPQIEGAETDIALIFEIKRFAGI